MTMIKLSALFLAVFFSVNETATIDTLELALLDGSRERPVTLRLWYPKDDKCSEKVCVASTGESVPLVVISHGAFGSPREMNWLGRGLAENGMLVVGVAHYGESWMYGPESVDRSIIARKWLRTEDIRFALDQVLAPGFTNVMIDPTSINLIGHSLGGYTALSLVGANENSKAMFDYCKTAIAHDMGCRYGRGIQSQQLPATSGQQVNRRLPQPRASASAVDPRITAVVALDPAIGPAVSKDTLGKISVATLIIGSFDNDFLSFDAHAKYYAEAIPDASLLTLIDGEGHFVYLDLCDHGHTALGVPLCKDREGVKRAQVHQYLVSKISSFLTLQ